MGWDRNINKQLLWWLYCFHVISVAGQLDLISFIMRRRHERNDVTNEFRSHFVFIQRGFLFSESLCFIINRCLWDSLDHVIVLLLRTTRQDVYRLVSQCDGRKKQMKTGIRTELSRCYCRMIVFLIGLFVVPDALNSRYLISIFAF